MADPFESLRHDAEGTGSTAIHPRFRADLLAEARRRLSATSTDSLRPRATADTPTPIPMEPIPMLAKQPKKTRPLLLAAACVALVAAGALTVAALGADDDKPPAPAETIQPTTIRTVPPEQPATPETTAVAQVVPTTIATDPDDALVAKLLLTEPEYHPGVPALTIGATSSGIVWESPDALAEQLPACREYVDSVFRPISAHDGYREFGRSSPPGWARSYVSVLESDEQAISVMNALADPGFLQCGVDYFAAGRHKTIPDPLGYVGPSEPTFDTIGDQLNYYVWQASWTDHVGGVTHGPETLGGALIRVGRTISYVEGLYHTDSPDQSDTITPDEFRAILQNVVTRAEAVLSGREYEPALTTVDARIADSMLLNGEEYGPDWTVVPNGSVLPTTNSAIASGLPACAPFVDSVFGELEQGTRALNTFFYAAPEALLTQYVAVLSDAARARAIYDLVNSAAFVACASAYGSALDGGQSPAVFPSPVDQPITEPPFAPMGDALTYRTFQGNWYDVGGGEHGPRTYVDAVMLVGRTITFVGTITDAEGGATLNTIDQFGSALERVAARAAEARA